MSPEEKHYLKALWTDPKKAGAFTGPEKLYKIVKAEGKHKISLEDIRDFLSTQDAYSLQRKVNRKFKRRHIIADSIDSHWDGDLLDARGISKHNDGFQYIMVLQDVF